MARVRLYLDTRPTKDGKCHVKISISHNKTTALMPTGIFVKPEHWNAGASYTDPHVKKTCEGYKAFNNILSQKIAGTQERVSELVLNGVIDSFGSATQIKNHIQGKKDGVILVADHFKDFIGRRNCEGTAGVYRETLTKISRYHNIVYNKFLQIKRGAFAPPAVRMPDL